MFKNIRKRQPRSLDYGKEIKNQAILPAAVVDRNKLNSEACVSGPKLPSSPIKMPIYQSLPPRGISNDYLFTPDDYCKEEDLVIDPENVKHYLQNSWTFWYLETDRNKSWEEMQLEISTVNTVEEFWIMYSHFKPPSQLRSGCDYSFFKKSIRPMWEDPANREGGRWVITFFKNCREDLDNIWLDVMLCLIGETLRNSNEICGAVVNIRGKNNKISVWTSNGKNESAILDIGCRLREALHLGSQNLKYQFHRDLWSTTKLGVQSAYIL